MSLTVWKLITDFEKEEKFLNEMMANGYAFTKYSWGKYTFEKAPKGEYIYRLELLEHLPEHEESQKYIRFMEETGAELVDTFHRWAYFRKKAADGEFKIYSDLDSIIKHYMRIRMTFFLVAIFVLLAGILNMVIGIVSSPPNIYFAVSSFILAAALFVFGVIPTGKRINILQKERALRE